LNNILLQSIVFELDLFDAITQVNHYSLDLAADANEPVGFAIGGVSADVDQEIIVWE
jgi:hypothetical protein